MKEKFGKFKKIPLLLSLGFLFLSVLLLVFVYRATEKNNQLSEQVGNEWQAEAQKREEVQTLARSLKMTEEERRILDTHFVKSSDLVAFLDSIEKSAKSVGSHSEITLVDVSKDKLTLDVGVRADGSFESLYKFITLIENSQYLLDVTYLDLLQTNSGEGGSTTWSVNLKVKLLTFIN